MRKDSIVSDPSKRSRMGSDDQSKKKREKERKKKKKKEKPQWDPRPIQDAILMKGPWRTSRFE